MKQEQNNQQLLLINIQKTVQNNLELIGKSRSRLANEAEHAAKTDRQEREDSQQFFSAIDEKQIVIKRKNINFNLIQNAS